jgi:hypothetical protein
MLLAAMLQQASARSLVFAMALAYVMCFAGLIFAYINYRRRQKNSSKGKGQ